ncbi:glutathione S-transferase family protein [Kamptonema formosum]|uniref:glutathione S-transferase family protein n=1 Tax=Kamptonema formosum TaxID=331992 RepID=UPI00037AD5C5|nr:glutathione S-transferase family protein [Oscillatoria sp. PCC 10802]
MLKLYHHPVSFNSRRVWVALLEKSIEFELVPLNLDGDQLRPEFLAINPFHHIPVLEDDGFPVIESLAILDYIEAKYPEPAMLPAGARDIALVRMVEMVAVNELLPAMNPLIGQSMGFSPTDAEKLRQAKEKLATVLAFLERQLGERPYFGAEHITLADLVAGTAVPWLPSLGLPLDDFPKLSAWCSRLTERPSWQKTHPTPEIIDAFKSRMKERMAAREKV